MKSAMKMLVATTASLAFALAGEALAQDNFYAGKTINLIVGTAPGGNYDIYARALAAAMPKHIPGSPSIVVQNINNDVPMANHVYSSAPKDGTTIGLVSASIITYQVLGGSNADYEPEKIAWLGRLWNTNGLFISWHTSGVKTIEDAKVKEIPFGALSATNATYYYGLLANSLLGTKFKLVPGYKGEELDLALERGEVGASSRTSVDGLFTRNIGWWNEKKVHPLMQVGDQRDPRLPDIPTFKELASSDRDRQLIDLITLPSDFGHSYWVSPEVPADRLEILRAAFRKTTEDPEFRAVMEKFKTTVRYETPQYLEKRVAAVVAAPADVKAAAAKIILPK